MKIRIIGGPGSGKTYLAKKLSAQLGIPFVTDVCEILDADEKKMICRKNTDNGFAEVEIRLPALITVSKDINMPRFPTISGIRFSLSAPFRSFTAEGVNADLSRCGLAGSPTQVVRSFTPDRAHKAERMTGSMREIAEKTLRIFEEVR